MKYLISLIIVMALVGIISSAPLHPEMVSAGTSQSTEKSDFGQLEGRWVRPDGGYIPELRDIMKDGSLTASYFNPRPINVHQAKWNQKKGTIKLFVELRDVNYPGSKYNLQYDPASDRLTGIYFQAVMRQEFEVEFIRTK